MKKMIGRKPKIYRFVHEYLEKDEVTGECYYKPYRIVYCTLKPYGCERTGFEDTDGCFCKAQPGTIRISGEDAHGDCMGCGGSIGLTQEMLDTNGDYFKWAITADINVAVRNKWNKDKEKNNE